MCVYEWYLYINMCIYVCAADSFVAALARTRKYKKGNQTAKPPPSVSTRKGSNSGALCWNTLLPNKGNLLDETMKL